MNIEHYCYHNFIKQNDIVYDIGAHVGEMSIYFLNLGAKKVYAFEPVGFNYDNLISNTKNYENIIPINCALHNKEYKCITKFKHCNRTYPQDTNEHGNEINIEYKILENIIKENKIEFPDFIKLDLEGMESIVLTTFDFLFKNKRPIIFVELHVAPKNEPQRYENNPHWTTVEDGGFNFNELKKYNYVIIDKSLLPYDDNIDWNPTPILHKGIILIPKEKYIKD